MLHLSTSFEIMLHGCETSKLSDTLLMNLGFNGVDLHFKSWWTVEYVTFAESIVNEHGWYNTRVAWCGNSPSVEKMTLSSWLSAELRPAAVLYCQSWVPWLGRPAPCVCCLQPLRWAVQRGRVHGLMLRYACQP
ncbi:hypothetical protein ABBQ32_008041 [Trebouxia sp. C0010 RCD-2024]